MNSEAHRLMKKVEAVMLKSRCSRSKESGLKQ